MGAFRHHAALLGTLLAYIEFLGTTIAPLGARLVALLEPYQAHIRA